MYNSVGSVGSITVGVALISIIAYYYMSRNKMTTKTVVSMASSGFLFLSHMSKASNSLTKVSKYVQKVLYINVVGTEDFLPQAARQIDRVYVKALEVSAKLDVRLILKPASSRITTNVPVDVILYDSSLTKDITSLKTALTSVSKESNLQSVDANCRDEEPSEEQVKLYDNVVLGGTFDRLHNAHKILLSQAALRTKKKLTVGVTDVNMLQSKTLYELIEPVEKRIQSVRDFLTDINPDLEYDVLAIQDMYGPTKSDPSMQLLVVSEETLRGADKVNEARKERGLPPLDRHVISLATDVARTSTEEESKLSSSNQRMRLLGTLLKPVEPNPRIPDWPYVIGLSGTIASGKTNITKRLEAKGAAIINCDLLAHELYAPGTPLNASIAETFGRDVITELGEVDRRKLGAIVFADKEKLEKLNQLAWPAVIAEASRRIQQLGAAGHKVVVLEAAVMVRAKWYHYTHQLWATIIPPQEAVKRLQERNNLTEEEAKQRVASQPSNLEQVAPAHIVFSPYWSYEHTGGQVDRAWEHLQQYLATRK